MIPKREQIKIFKTSETKGREAEGTCNRWS